MPDYFQPIDSEQLCRMLGLLGFCLYVLNYGCLAMRVHSAEGMQYFVLNTVAATLVLVGLSQDFNLASALIQGFWILIGLCAILVRLRRALALRARMERIRTGQAVQLG